MMTEFIYNFFAKKNCILENLNINLIFDKMFIIEKISEPSKLIFRIIKQLFVI